MSGNFCTSSASPTSARGRVIRRRMSGSSRLSKTYGPPRLQEGFDDRLIGLRKRIRSREMLPRPRWRSARPGSHKRHGIAAPFFEPGCQGAGRPQAIFMSFPQTSWVAAVRRRAAADGLSGDSAVVQGKVPLPRQHRPGDPRQLVGERYDSDIAVGPCQQPT